jgi:hypothetical protein
MQITFSEHARVMLLERVAAMRRAHDAYVHAMQSGDDAWADLFEKYRKAAAAVGLAVDTELKLQGIEVPTYSSEVTTS